MWTPPKTKIWVGKLTFAAVILAQFSTFSLAFPADTELDGGSLAARAGTLPPNRNCRTNSDCSSGVCFEPFVPAVCDRLDTNGTVVDCYGSAQIKGRSYCLGYPLGHKCANQGECRNGFCSKDGICVKTTVDQACNDDLGCSGKQVCRDHKCFLPASGSLYPEVSCKTNSSCVSGQCSTVLQSDTNPVSPAPFNTRLQCTYISLNRTGCRSYLDCKSGLCDKEVCQIGADGAKCVTNAQCANLCGLDGVCYSPNPKKLLTPDQPCKNDTQCLSGVCYEPQGTTIFPVTRPDAARPGQNYTTYNDDYCAGVLFGGRCGTTGDCAQGYCVDGKCKGTVLGSSCTEDKSCKSLTCISGKCAVAKAYAPCTKNSTCFSNNCATTDCPVFVRPCTPTHCQPVPFGQPCRIRTDCNNASFNVCDDGICNYDFYTGGP